MSDPTSTALGTLIQRSDLPGDSIDAIECWLVPVQEVPPKAEIRFYAIRGERRELLTSDDAAVILREHVTKRPVTELSTSELMIEISVLRAEVDQMRPIYAAVKVWREQRRAWPATTALEDVAADVVLVETVDAANKTAP